MINRASSVFVRPNRGYVCLSCILNQGCSTRTRRFQSSQTDSSPADNSKLKDNAPPILDSNRGDSKDVPQKGSSPTSTNSKSTAANSDQAKSKSKSGTPLEAQRGVGKRKHEIQRRRNLMRKRREEALRQVAKARQGDRDSDKERLAALERLVEEMNARLKNIKGNVGVAEEDTLSGNAGEKLSPRQYIEQSLTQSSAQWAEVESSDNVTPNDESMLVTDKDGEASKITSDPDDLEEAGLDPPTLRIRRIESRNSRPREAAQAVHEDIQDRAERARKYTEEQQELAKKQVEKGPEKGPEKENAETVKSATPKRSRVAKAKVARPEKTGRLERTRRKAETTEQEKKPANSLKSKGTAAKSRSAKDKAADISEKVTLDQISTVDAAELQISRTYMEVVLIPTLLTSCSCSRSQAACSCALAWS